MNTGRINARPLAADEFMSTAEMTVTSRFNFQKLWVNECNEDLPPIIPDGVTRANIASLMNVRLIGFAIGGVILGLLLLGGIALGQAKGNRRVFAEDAFRVALPEDWTGGLTADKERWSYHSRDRGQQLTVSLLGMTQPMDTEQRSAAFKRIVALRHDAETKMPDGPKGVKVTDPNFAENGGILAARYGGRDAAGRQFRCLLLGGSRAITIFYFESLQLDDSAADARARAIFNSITVPN